MTFINKEARIFAEFKNGESTPYIVYTTNNDQEVIQLAQRVSLQKKAEDKDDLNTVGGALAYLENDIHHRNCYLEVYDFETFQGYEKQGVELPKEVMEEGKQLAWLERNGDSTA